MDFYESVSIFSTFIPSLLIEENEFLSSLYITESDRHWMFGLTEDDKESSLDPELKKKIDAILSNHKVKNADLSFGPTFTDERTYIDVPSPTQNTQTTSIPKEIKDYVSSKGYEITDYISGIATNQTNKTRKMRLGKLIKDPKLKKAFDERLKGKKKSQDDLQAVFTYNPRDIATMSTGRGWTSCADLNPKDGLGGPASKQIPNKISAGGMVVYLINKGDKNIKNPIARISVRRLVSIDNGSFILLPEKQCYGSEVPEFVDLVRSTLAKNNKETVENKMGVFQDAEGGYSDTFQDVFYDMHGDVDEKYYSKKLYETWEDKDWSEFRKALEEIQDQQDRRNWSDPIVTKDEIVEFIQSAMQNVYKKPLEYLLGFVDRGKYFTNDYDKLASELDWSVFDNTERPPMGVVRVLLNNLLFPNWRELIHLMRLATEASNRSYPEYGYDQILEELITHKAAWKELDLGVGISSATERQLEILENYMKHLLDDIQRDINHTNEVFYSPKELYDHLYGPQFPTDMIERLDGYEEELNKKED